MSASVEFIHVDKGGIGWVAFDKYGQEWQRRDGHFGQKEWIRINGPTVIPPDTEKDTLRAQVAGLTKGISKFMCDEKSLRKRLAEQETALRKRKKQVQVNSEQINYLMADLYFEHLCNMVSNYTGYIFTFEEWKDRWLRNKGYKEAV